MENFIKDLLLPNLLTGIINGIIFIFLLSALCAGLKTTGRYKGKEKKALETVEHKIDQKRSELKPTDQAKNSKPDPPNDSPGNNPDKKIPVPDTLMNLDDLREFVDKESIVYKRMDMIDRMRNQRVKINIDFLQQTAITAETTGFGVTFPKLSANLGMILGLFGTFLGLTIMVNKISILMPNPTAIDLSFSTLQSSMNDMDTIFRGIKTAFSTSVAGIFTALCCLLLNYTIHKRQATFFHQLEIFTVEKLIPATVPAVESEVLMEDVAFRLQDSFHSLNHIITQNNDTLNNLNAVETSFKTIVDQVRDITRREESRNFEKVMGLLTDNNRSLVLLVEQWPKMAETMKENSQLAERKINSVLETMKRQQETFDNEITRIMQIRKGGAVINISRLSDIAIVVSLVVIFVVILISILK